MTLARRAHGLPPLPLPVDYPWGAAFEEWAIARPQARIINLETSITRSETFAEKAINYRMSPENAACLTSAAIDICVLANNHVLDWGESGLLETLNTLRGLRIRCVGAGAKVGEAQRPAIMDVADEGRIVLQAFAHPSSGTPLAWSAGRNRAGVNLLPTLDDAAVARVARQFEAVGRPRDIRVVSLHWDANWGYDIPDGHRRFAHALIDEAGVSIVYGHSSHHAKAIEVYRGRLILYGCGDFLNDYEGIEGYEGFRGDLAIMYFADIDAPTGQLRALTMTPLQIKRFRLNHPRPSDVDWLRQTLDRESRAFGASVSIDTEKRLRLSWAPSAS